MCGIVCLCPHNVITHPHNPPHPTSPTTVIITNLPLSPPLTFHSHPHPTYHCHPHSPTTLTPTPPTTVTPTHLPLLSPPTYHCHPPTHLPLLSPPTYHCHPHSPTTAITTHLRLSPPHSPTTVTPTQALAVLPWMEGTGVTADVYLMSALLFVCAKTKRVGEAERLFWKDIPARNLTYSVATTNR